MVLVVVLAIALVTGPLLLVQPLPRDRYRAALRQAAASRGLRLTLEAPPRLATDTEEPVPTPVYCRPGRRKGDSHHWLLLRAAYEHPSHFLGHWCWRGPRAPDDVQHLLGELLPKLPDSVSGVGAGVRGHYVYWNERGGDEVLARIDQCLLALAGQNAA